jgi:aldose sugar dehydrogenase
MNPRHALAAALLAAGLAACGGTSNPPDQSPTSVSSGAQQISGAERLGWNQIVASLSEISSLRFFALVDGKSVELTGVACLLSADTTFACSSALPSMSPGAHTLQLVAFDGILESPPSTPPLSVILVGKAVSTSSVGVNSGVATTSVRETTTDGVPLDLAVLTRGLVDPTDVTATPDGRILAAERSGRVRLFRDGGLQSQPAGVLSETVASGGALLALAVDPSFPNNHWVYALHTVASERGVGRLDVRITRLREAGGTLIDAVTLLSGVHASPSSSGALRFGSDGKLYATFDDGGIPSASEDAASYNGKLLRLNTDGTTPGDQAASSPVLIGLPGTPRALALARRSQPLWVCQELPDGSERLTPVVVTEGRSTRAQSDAPYSLPQAFGIGGAVAYLSPVVPEFNGNLFVGARSGRYLLRIRLDEDGVNVRSTERLLVNRVSGIRAVAVGIDGSIYVANASSLYRLSTGQAAPSAPASSVRIAR